MWPFRRRARPEPTGTLRIGEHSSNAADYDVWTVSESRHPEAFEELWSQAWPTEREGDVLRRWAQLVPVRDPRFGVADVGVDLDGRRACYLRPPHLDTVAHRAAEAGVLALEVPALIERGPGGTTVRLIIAD